MLIFFAPIIAMLFPPLLFSRPFRRFHYFAGAAADAIAPRHAITPRLLLLPPRDAMLFAIFLFRYCRHARFADFTH
jgi:hypothetical protein